MSNTYATLDDIKARLGITATTQDTIFLELLEAASRKVDEMCRRHFYIETATKYVDTQDSATDLLLPDDLITATTLTTDTEGDGTHDGETWTGGTDFFLWPYNGLPKQKVQTTGFGSYGFPKLVRRYVKLIGVWGHGDGINASPFTATAITVTADNASETELDVSAEGTIEAGHTIRLVTGDDAEDAFVSAATADGTKTITVRRGVNGSTAAAHAVIASIADYPRQIMQSTLVFTAQMFDSLGESDHQSEGLGDYRYTSYSPENQAIRETRLIAAYRRLTAV